MNQGSIDPHVQGVVSLVSEEGGFHAIPFVGGQLRTTPPLGCLGCNVIAGDMVGTQYAFDLSYADFVIGIGGFLDPEEMLVVIASHIAERDAEVNVSTGIEALGTGRQGTDDLCRALAAFEVDRLGAAVGFGAIDQCVGSTGGGVAVIAHIADEVIPAGWLGIHGTAFKGFGEQHTDTVVNGRAAASHSDRAAGA